MCKNASSASANQVSFVQKIARQYNNQSIDRQRLAYLANYCEIHATPTLRAEKVGGHDPTCATPMNKNYFLFSYHSNREPTYC